MPRTARASCADVCYHVVSRGNARQTVFQDAGDYDAFTELLRRGCETRPLQLLAWCLMPNHFHIVVRPGQDRELGTWMHWLLTSHVGYHRRRHSTTGRIWQGRFKAFPIQADTHLLTVLRYVERNPVRAGLAQHAAEWKWSSMRARDPESGEPVVRGGTLAPSPVELPRPWTEWVSRPLTPAELLSVRQSAQRERPYGDLPWCERTAERLDMWFAFNSRGRPRSVIT